MTTVSDIFDRFGGPARVAEVIGKTTEHAAIMRRRRSIPIRYWAAIVEADPLRGQRVTHSDLVEAHAHRPERFPSEPTRVSA